MIDSVKLPWMAEVGLISWRSVAKKKRPPLPSELLATFIVFGAFGLVSIRAPKVGSALGWGIVVATVLNLFDPTNPGAIVDTKGKLLGTSTQSQSTDIQAQPTPQAATTPKAPVTRFGKAS